MKANIAAFVLALTACQTPSGHEQSAKPAPSLSAEASALAELEKLDQRTPLPLLPMMANHQKQNMREHLVAVQEMVSAAGRRDFSKVAQAAQRIGYSEAMGRTCEHMGAAAPGFTEQALAFHHSADDIVAAAKREDSAAVLEALGETLARCTACHATYKQKLVSELSHEAPLAADRP
jgi:hypothetical protein